MTRKIVGSIISGGKVFVAGQEDAFALRMQGRSVQHLVDNGTLAGHWSDATASEAVAIVSEPVAEVVVTDSAQTESVEASSEVDPESSAESPAEGSVPASTVTEQPTAEAPASEAANGTSSAPKDPSKGGAKNNTRRNG